MATAVLHQVSDLFKDYFKGNNERIGKYTNYVVQLYQYYDYDTDQTLNEITSQHPDQEEKLKGLKELTQKAISEYIKPNLEKIYAIKNEEPPPAPPTKKEQAEAVYEEMVKACQEHFNGEEKAREYMVHLIDVYSKCDLNKKATIKKITDPYPKETMVPVVALTEKLLEKVDFYLTLVDTESDDEQDQQTSVQKKDEKKDEKETEIDVKALEKEMLDACIEFFDDKDEAEEYLHHLVTEYRNRSHDKKQTIDAVIDMAREFGCPWQMITKLRKMNEKVLHSLDLYLVMEDSDKTQKEQAEYQRLLDESDDELEGAKIKVDGLSDIDPDDLPKFDNCKEWKDHFPDDYWDEIIQPKPTTGQKSERKWNMYKFKWEWYTTTYTIPAGPAHPRKDGVDYGVWTSPKAETPKGFERAPVWPRNKPQKQQQKGGKKTGPLVTYYDDSDDERLEEKQRIRQYHKILLSSGYPTMLPVHALREFSSFIAHNNKQFIPVAMKPEVAIRNIDRIEVMLDEVINNFRKEGHHIEDFSKWDEWNGIQRAFAKVRALKSLGEKEHLPFSEQDYEDLNEIIQVLRRFKTGLLFKTYVRDSEDTLTPYMFIFSPYQWCYKCQSVRLRSEVYKDDAYDFLCCNECKMPIYHLKTARYFMVKHWKHNYCVPVLDDYPPEKHLKPRPDNYWILKGGLNPLLNHCWEAKEKIMSSIPDDSDEEIVEEAQKAAQQVWNEFLTKLDVDQLRTEIYAGGEKANAENSHLPTEEAGDYHNLNQWSQQFDSQQQNVRGYYPGLGDTNDNDETTHLLGSTDQYNNVANFFEKPDPAGEYDADNEHDTEMQEIPLGGSNSSDEHEEGYDQASDYDDNQMPV